MSKFVWTVEHAERIHTLKETRTWSQVRAVFNKEYDSNLSVDAIRFGYKRFSDLIEPNIDNIGVGVFRSLRSSRRTASRNNTAANKVMDYLECRDNILEELKNTIKELNKKQLPKPVKIKKSRSKPNMTKELLLSDLHYGKKTESFNYEVARQRMQELTHTVVGEIDRAKVHYDVEKLVICLLGDIIESATMHREESAKNCEFGNSKQIVSAVESLMYDMLIPLYQTGVPIHIVGVPGNHDRTHPEKTYVNPGEENVTYIIYNMLKMMADQLGMKITWQLPTKGFTYYTVYGCNVLLEHGDMLKNASLQSMTNLLAKRQQQLNVVLHFMRIGHFHEPTEYGRGKFIVNGSLPGADSYSDAWGFDSHAVQKLNSYIETSERPTSFYKSMNMYLD